MPSKFLICFLLIGLSLFFCQSVFALEYQLEQPLPGGEETVSGITEYVKTFYLFGLGLVGVAALFALVFGGIIYMTAGTITSTEEAKKWIWGALGGLLLMLGSYLILNTINPDLVTLKEPEVIFPTAPTACTAGCDPDCQYCNTETGNCVNEPDNTDCQVHKICQGGKCKSGSTQEGGSCQDMFECDRSKCLSCMDSKCQDYCKTTGQTCCVGCGELGDGECQ